MHRRTTTPRHRNRRRRLVFGLLLLAAPAYAAEIDWTRAADEAVEKLRAYVRVDTTNPPGNETPAAELLRDWLAAEGIEARLYDPMDNPDRQALVARLPGRSERTVVLMSHSDVVPAVASEWSHPPFAADVVDGAMYGRGTADTKGLGVLQVMTLLLMRRHGMVPNDTLMLLIEPDEEEGGRGASGMLAKYPALFKNTRMVLNEGGSAVVGLFKPGQTVVVVQTAEKGAAWMKLTARGEAGHGSIPRANNAVATMARALGRIAAYETPLRPSATTVEMFRALAEQASFPESLVAANIDNRLVRTLFAGQLTKRPLVNALLRTTISLTGVHGGYKTNVIPAEVEASLDCRINMGDTADGLRSELERVVGDPRVRIELVSMGHVPTPNESPIDATLMEIVRDVSRRHLPGSLVVPMMSSGVTDSSYFRLHGIPAYGVSPIAVDEAAIAAVHGVDERLQVDHFRAAVRMYYEIVTALAG